MARTELEEILFQDARQREHEHLMRALNEAFERREDIVAFVKLVRRTKSLSEAVYLTTQREARIRWGALRRPTGRE